MMESKYVNTNYLNSTDVTDKFIFDTAVISILGIINSTFYSNKSIMIVVVGIEIVILMYQLVEKQYLCYLKYYIAFMTLSLESPNFVGTEEFYGFKSFEVLGINIGVLMIFPLLIMLLSDGKIVFYKQSELSQFVKHTSVIVCLGIIVGAVHWVFNDNSAYIIAGFRDFLEYCYIHVFVLAVLLCFYKIIISGRFDFCTLENILFSIIIAIAITMIFSLLTHNYGNRGGLESLQVSNLYMLLPCSFLILFYRDVSRYKRYLVFTASLIVLILSLLFNANGKMVLALFLSILLLAGILFKQNRMLFFVAMLFMPVVLVFLYKTLLRVTSDNYLLYVKIQQGLHMLTFWKKDWLETLDGSPKFRIQELVTIVFEYLNKPWDIFLGKGYMGAVEDHLGYFADATVSTFPEFERTNHYYVGMHESLNSLFLTNGFFGLVYFFKYVLKCIKISFQSFWGIIGGFWFVLFFSYSITIAAYGIIAMSVALYLYDVRNNKISFSV